MLAALFQHVVLASAGVTAILILIQITRLAVRSDLVFRYTIERALILVSLLVIPVQCLVHEWNADTREPFEVEQRINSHTTRPAVLTTFLPDQSISKEFRAEVRQFDESERAGGSGETTNTVWQQWVHWPLLVPFYFGGVVVLAAGYIARFVRTVALVLHSEPITRDSSLHRQIGGMDRESSAVRRMSRLRIFYSDSLASPASLWLLRPIILLPRGIVERLGSQPFEAVMAHELVHLRRRDWFWATCEAAVRIIFWFHPWVWVATRQIKLDRELSCDAVVIRHHHDPKTYAMSILALYESRRTLSMSTLSFATIRSIKRRIEMLGSAKHSLRPRSKAVIGSLVLILALLPFLLTPNLTLACSVPHLFEQRVVLHRVAQEASPQKPTQKVTQAAEEWDQLLEVNQDLGKLYADGARRSRGEFVTDEEIDLNGDGVNDVAFQSTYSHGGRSTHFVVWRAIGLNGTKFLKQGHPLPDGTTIRVRDLLTAVSQADLCSVGGSLSLAFKDVSGDHFCGGPWWNKSDMAMAVVLPQEHQVQVGYVLMSINKSGMITVGKSVFSEGFADSLVVQMKENR